MQAEILLEKIKNLPPEKVVEVEDFVEFLNQKAIAKQMRQQEIGVYAARYGGTQFDIDNELETTAAEHLINETKNETW